MIRPILLITLSLLPELVLAHSDHGSTILSNVDHVMTHMEHSWPLLLAVVVVIAMVKRPLGGWLKNVSCKD